MDSIQDLFAAIMVVVGIVGTFIARFQATSSKLGLIARLAIVFDLTQIFDSTRALSDEPEDVDFEDPSDFDDEVQE